VGQHPAPRSGVPRRRPRRLDRRVGHRVAGAPARSL
jgi:hypothetical protein